MISDKYSKIIKCLRQDSRMTLTEISKATSIPVSTLYDRLKQKKPDFIKGYTVLLDYYSMGYVHQNKVIIKVKENKSKILDYLKENEGVNSIWEINQGDEILFESIHQSPKDFIQLMNTLTHDFGVEEKTQLTVIDEIKKEGFYR